MASDTVYRIAFWILFLLTLLVFGRGFARAQVSAEVNPKVAVVSNTQTTFRFTWRIEPSKDNRMYALSYTCGVELHSSQGELTESSPRTTERYVNLTVIEDCQFMACVARVVKGRVKLETICAWVFVSTGG